MNANEQLKTKILLSSTSLGSGNCGLAFYRRVVKGYRSPKMHPRLVYGVAFHKFMDVACKTKDLKLAKEKALQAFELPKVEPKRGEEHLSDFNHLFKVACEAWFTWIADDQSFSLIADGDGKPLTEQSFQIPFYKGEVLEVDLAGTLDKIGKIAGGIFAFGDWKTTSSWDNKGYFKQYELARQLRLYRLATLLEAERNPESVVGRLGKEPNLGAFIDAVFLKPSVGEVKFERSKFFIFHAEEMEEFKQGLLRWCKRFEQSLIDGTVHARDGIVTGACEGKWGKCDYWNICAAPKGAVDVMLKSNFNQIPWNPLDYNGLED